MGVSFHSADGTGAVFRPGPRRKDQGWDGWLGEWRNKIGNVVKWRFPKMDVPL